MAYRLLDLSLQRASPVEGCAFTLTRENPRFGIARVQGEEEGLPIPKSLTALISSARSQYPPALAMAQEDIHSYGHRKDLTGEDFLRLAEHTLDYHLRTQGESKSFLARAPKSVWGDILQGHYYWIVGAYGPAVLGNTRVLFVSYDYITYSAEPNYFGLDGLQMLERFPRTPVHYVDQRVLSRPDYVIPSCSDFVPRPPP